MAEPNGITPAAAGFFSIIPGLGQLATGNAFEGIAWFGTVVGLASMKEKYLRNSAMLVWEYNIYDAYRDAGAKDTGKQTALENGVAFLNPANLIDPVSIGIVGTGAYTGWRSKNVVRQGPRDKLAGAAFFGLVGFGEEGLFRGALFPGFSHLTNSYVAGAVLSSMTFSAAHLVNKNRYYHSFAGLATIFVGGMLLCYQTYSYKFDLRHSMFTHAWFDFSVEYLHIGSEEPISIGKSAPTIHFNLQF